MAFIGEFASAEIGITAYYCRIQHLFYIKIIPESRLNEIMYNEWETTV